MSVLLLPSITAASAAVLAQQVFHWEPLVHLPLPYDGFRLVHLLWAILIGVVAGAAGLAVDRAVPLLRRITVALEARHLVLMGAVGGLVLGGLYAIGGEEVRFSGIPELLQLAVRRDTLGAILVALVVKILASSWSIAAGYRGGRIFPAAFVGGAAALAMHQLIPSIPISLALAVGMSAAMATALRYPVVASLNAAAMVPATLLPLSLIGVVAAHSVHLLADEVTAARPQPSGG
ncbi:MAG: chloride channel protein [Acidimicrobiaceae bacterium]|nr:chloride channel protein [Ilumatobacter sp.]MCB9381029.1 chloride channel protein [Acidimicrobiaceae bacterium]MCO5330769.1 chloride channel protein [Ilumatobacteraceae bacterium]